MAVHRGKPTGITSPSSCTRPWPRPALQHLAAAGVVLATIGISIAAMVSGQR